MKISGFYFNKRINGHWVGKGGGYYHSQLVEGLDNAPVANVSQRGYPRSRTFNIEVRVTCPDGDTLELWDKLRVKAFRSAGTMIGTLGTVIPGIYKFRVRVFNDKGRRLCQRWYKVQTTRR